MDVGELFSVAICDAEAKGRFSASAPHFAAPSELGWLGVVPVRDATCLDAPRELPGWRGGVAEAGVGLAVLDTDLLVAVDAAARASSSRCLATVGVNHSSSMSTNRSLSTLSMSSTSKSTLGRYATPNSYVFPNKSSGAKSYVSIVDSVVVAVSASAVMCSSGTLIPTRPRSIMSHASASPAGVLVAYPSGPHSLIPSRRPVLRRRSRRKSR